jgi:glycosyltransferase involved in cell wall biosynthesis
VRTWVAQPNDAAQGTDAMANDARPGRVLLVTASARRRGAEIQATQLAPQLATLGWAVDIVSLHTGTDGTMLDIPVLGSRRLGPATLLALRRRARQVDVVIAYGSATLPACAIALAATGVPFLYRSISDPAHWLRGSLHRRVTQAQYRRAAGVVALWPAAAERLAGELGVEPDRIAVIPNARDGDVFRSPTADERAAARETYGLKDGPVVAFIGAASPEKRLDLAIETVANLPGHTLLVAGGGSGLARAREQAHDLLGDRVVFLGEVDDVRPVLYASDVVLITSDVEGMPGVAIEAALCGVPVVATPVGAIPSMEWIVVAEPTSDRLAAAVLEVTHTPRHTPRSFGSAAVSHTWPHVATQWHELLGSVVRARGRA